MLVLRRRAGESLLIGEDVEIQILDINAQTVKLGIVAPRQVPILRKELHITKMENQSAARQVDLEQLADLLTKNSE